MPGHQPPHSDVKPLQAYFSSPEKQTGGQNSIGMALILDTILSSWINILLVFVPVGLWAFLSAANPTIIFVLNGIAIIPLASLLTKATEQIAHDAGDTIGALLNISLGNLVELILFVALKHNQIHIVQASILGSMLVNLLPILGTALCVSGFSQHDPTINTSESQLLSCLLIVSAFVFVIPAAFYNTFNEADTANMAVLNMSRASALVVLLIYILYFVHEFRTHSARRSYHAAPASSDDPESALASPMILSRNAEHLDSELRTVPLHSNRLEGDVVGAPCESVSGPRNTQIELDDIDLAGSEAGHDPKDNSGPDEIKSQISNLRSSSRGPSDHRDLASLPGQSVRGVQGRDSSSINANHRRATRPRLSSLQTLRVTRMNLRDSSEEETSLQTSLARRVIPMITLIISSFLMSMCAEFLVGTIDEVTRQGHLSESVIGLTILPIVGNVAEYVTVVTVAARENMDLAIAVAVGSSIQIALCVAPLTILASWALSRDLSLDFNMFEVAALLGAVLLVNLLILGDGSTIMRTRGLKGALMCACYGIIGFGAYLSPETRE